MNDEILQKNIERFDKYIERADSKASLILTLASAILAITIFRDINSAIHNIGILKNTEIILNFTVNIGLIFSIVQALCVIIPRTPKSINKKSVYYFEDIKDMTITELDKRIQENTIKDIEGQCIILAQICSKKMLFIKRAYYGLGISLFGIAILSIINLVLV